MRLFALFSVFLCFSVFFANADFWDDDFESSNSASEEDIFGEEIGDIFSDEAVNVQNEPKKVKKAENTNQENENDDNEVIRSEKVAFERLFPGLALNTAKADFADYAQAGSKAWQERDFSTAAANWYKAAIVVNTGDQWAYCARASELAKFKKKYVDFLWKKAIKLGITDPQAVNMIPIDMYEEKVDQETLIAKKFELIYRHNLWSNGDGTLPRSGPGSSIAATISLRKAVESVLNAPNLNIRTVLDIGCGDLTWLSSIPALYKLDSYLGIDIAQPIIDDLREKFPNKDLLKKLVKNKKSKKNKKNSKKNSKKSESDDEITLDDNDDDFAKSLGLDQESAAKMKQYRNMTFEIHDLSTTPLDRSFDLIIVRDVFKHLTLEQVSHMLNNIYRTKSRYLLVTTHPGILQNTDESITLFPVPGVGLRGLNLVLPPFNLPSHPVFGWQLSPEDHLALFKLPITGPQQEDVKFLKDAFRNNFQWEEDEDDTGSAAASHDVDDSDFLHDDDEDTPRAKPKPESNKNWWDDDDDSASDDGKKKQEASSDGDGWDIDLDKLEL